MMATDWGQILLKHGFDVPVEKVEFNILCPFHVDSAPSCAINVDKGLWICFRGCGQGSLKTFLQKYLGVPWSELDGQLEQAQWSLDLWDELEPLIADPIPDVELPNGLPIPDNHWIFRRGFQRSILEET